MAYRCKGYLKIKIYLQGGVCMLKQTLYMGSNYIPTKDRSIYDLKLFIERDLKRLSGESPELSMSFRVHPSFDRTNKRNWIDLEVFMNKRSSYSLFKPEIEAILWSYNKQLLVHRNGRFRTHYLRFGSSVKYRGTIPSQKQIFRSCFCLSRHKGRFHLGAS